MTILRRLFFPVSALLLLVVWPLRHRARRRALHASGWTELRLSGDVSELRPQRDVAQTFVRRILKRKDPPRVVLSRLRKFVDEMITDPYAKGVLVRIGALSGGWASAAAIRDELMRLREAGRQVVIHLENNVDNRQAMIAGAGTRVLMTPSGTMGAVGSASNGVFLRDTLDRLGLLIEAPSHGRYKSAPDQFTRVDRSEADEEQTRTLVDQLDDALLTSLMAGRVLNRADAEALIDAAPMVGGHAHKAGFCDAIARDEELGEALRQADGSDDAPRTVGAGRYLELRTIPKLWPVRRRVGVVRVHGPIIDQAGRFGLPDQEMAVTETVVDDLRAALADPKIGAVVMHINSRGGSVTASDAIYAAAARVNQEKPVIACFGDVAASGGYYVGCGARAIVASPLTVTGSIGVFAMIPTWKKLTERWAVGHDVLKNRKNAGLYDPWAGFDDETRAQAQREVSAMYDTFINLVAESRSLDVDDVDAVAQGRVWTGRDARQHRLLDDLGGFPAAVELAKSEAGGQFNPEPVIVTAKGPQSRPGPHDPDRPPARRRWLGARASSFDAAGGLLDGDGRPAAALAPGWTVLAAAGLLGGFDPVALETLALLAAPAGRRTRILAYAPIIAPV